MLCFCSSKIGRSVRNTRHFFRNYPSRKANCITQWLHRFGLPLSGLVLSSYVVNKKCSTLLYKICIPLSSLLKLKNLFRIFMPSYRSTLSVCWQTLRQCFQGEFMTQSIYQNTSVDYPHHSWNSSSKHCKLSTQFCLVTVFTRKFLFFIDNEGM